MKIKNYFIVLSFFFGFSLGASKRISVLTCGRGGEIYSTFGHSAFRIIDSASNTDIVYNYGLFHFSDPAFIPKFIHGQLDYMLGKESFEEFLAQYRFQQRWVREQVLDLTPTEADSLYKFLEWNAHPENAYYRYNFLYDNCATKILVVLKKVCPSIRIDYFEEQPKMSYRQLIHRYARESVPFIDWGMDLLIGAKVDMPATAQQYTFLPDFVGKTLDRSQNSRNGKLVKQEHSILSEYPLPISNPKNPVYAAIMILILAIWSRASQHKIALAFRFLYFLVLGMAGFLVLYVWFFTAHDVAKLNYNFLWLNPLMLIYSFLQFYENKWKITIRKICSAGIVLVPIAHWITGQNFHAASVWIMISTLIMLSSIKVKTYTI